MDIVNLFPTPIYTFKNLEFNNSELIDHCEKYADVLKHGEVISSMRNLHDKEELKPLFSWFGKCLETIRVDCRYDCDRFEITSSWFNKSMANSGMKLNVHRHSMSFFSAVYYLTDGSPTVFEDPVIHRTQAQLEVLRELDITTSPHQSIVAEPGKLIIFPSWLFHFSAPHIGENDRYIISFNTMPAGDVNYNIATDSVASIEILNKEKTRW